MPTTTESITPATLALESAVSTLFVTSSDADETVYAKAAAIVAARAGGVSNVRIIERIRVDLHAAGLSGVNPPSAGLLSQYAGGWKMLTDAGLDPEGSVHLVALAVRAKAGRFKKAQCVRIVAEATGLTLALREEALTKALEGPADSTTDATEPGESSASDAPEGTTGRVEPVTVVAASAESLSDAMRTMATRLAGMSAADVIALTAAADVLKSAGLAMLDQLEERATAEAAERARLEAEDRAAMAAARALISA